MPNAMKPFANDTSSATVGDLSCENGTDLISLSGSLDLAKDKRGLDDARVLHELLGAIVAALEAEGELPERAAMPKPAKVTKKPNPWG